jgi:alpha-D-xyloside xylohydrolase
LRIYTGADGEFVLYQDAGDNYDYEHGAHSLIPIHWSESNRTLTIGQREGEYSGMPASMEMKVVLVSAGHGTGLESTANPDKLVVYNGESISVRER